MDVPETIAHSPWSRSQVENILDPGPATVGYTPNSLVGPQLLKLDITPPWGSLMAFIIGFEGKVTVPFGVALRSNPSDGEIVAANTPELDVMGDVDLVGSEID
jgi:hypothetical protein